MLFIWRISRFIHIYFLVVISMGHNTFFPPVFKIFEEYIFRYIYIALNPLSDFVSNGDETLNFNCNNFYSNSRIVNSDYETIKNISNNDNRTSYVFSPCFFFPFFFYFVLFNITPFPSGTMFVFPWVYWVQFIRSFRACLCPIFVSRGKQYFTDK